MCNIQAAQINSDWVGGGYPAGFWNNADNWAPNIVPDNNASNTFNVTIDGGSGDKKQVYLLENRTINQVDCYGNVWLESRTPYNIEFTIVDNNGLTNYGNLRIRGGAYNERAQFKIIGSVRNEPGANLELFGAKIENDFYNASEATISVKYETCFTQGVMNDGIIFVDPASEMSVDANIINNGQIQLWGSLCAATGLLDNDVNGVITGFGVVHSTGPIHNSGALYVSADSLVLHTDSFLTNTGTLENHVGATLSVMSSVADVNNQGTIIVNASGAVTFDSNLTNEPNGIIQLNGGALAAPTITQSADANFVGFGGITGDVVIEPNGIIELTGPTNIVGDVDIATNATFEVSDGVTLVTGHTTNNGTIHMKGGRLIPQGGITNNGNVIWEPGLYNNVADFNLDGQVNFKDFADFSQTWLWQAQL